MYLCSIKLRQENNKNTDKMEKKFDTIYGVIICRFVFDPDTSINGEGFFEMYDENDGYYGSIYGVDEDDLTTEMLEEQIDENLIY